MNSVGLTVDAAVQTDLSFPVGAEVQAAEVASTLTAPAPAHAAGDQPGAAEVDAAVAEPPRPTLQELKVRSMGCNTACCNSASQYIASRACPAHAQTRDAARAVTLCAQEALHACTTQLREQQAADALESYNIMAKLYNKSQLARLYISDGRLLPLKDAEGNLPPAGACCSSCRFGAVGSATKLSAAERGSAVRPAANPCSAKHAGLRV